MAYGNRNPYWLTCPIRYAQSKDIKELQELFSAFYFYRINALQDTIKKKRILVATLEDKVVGLLNIGAKYDKILMLIVKDKYKRQGIARKLFHSAQLVYKTKTIWIEAVEDSITFWESIGFKKTGVYKETKHKKLTQMKY